MGNENISVGDRYVLHYCGSEYPYEVKDVNGDLFLIHDSDTPLGVPLTSIPVEEINDYDFERKHYYG